MSIRLEAAAKEKLKTRSRIGFSQRRFSSGGHFSKDSDGITQGSLYGVSARCVQPEAMRRDAIGLLS
jgi:hypothetical protein